MQQWANNEFTHDICLLAAWKFKRNRKSTRLGVKVCIKKEEMDDNMDKTQVALYLQYYVNVWNFS